MAKDSSKHSSVASYIIVALILGVITYIEYAIVEFPQAWLGRDWTMFWLIALSVVKFIMVIMFFMHLKDDDRTYTGFFSSGMFITMATFVALTAMFILPRAVSSTAPENVAAGRAGHEVPADVIDLVETNGRSRSAAAQADSPRPADRSVTIQAPRAGNDGSTYQVTVPGAAGAAADEVAGAAADEAAADQTDGTTAQTDEAAGQTDEAAGAEDEAAAAADDAEAEQAEDATAAGEDAQASATDTEGDEAEGATDEATAAAAAGSDQTPNEEIATEQAAAGQTPEDAAPETEAGAAASWDPEAGARVYAANCVACHQGNGQGIPSAFPPLADHTVHVYEAGGREFLMDVVLFGMQGPIDVNGMTYNGLMPGWSHLSDDDIANVLNHIVTAWDDEPAGFEPYQASEVADQRGLGLSAADVHEMRGELGL